MNRRQTLLGWVASTAGVVAIAAAWGQVIHRLLDLAHHFLRHHQAFGVKINAIQLNQPLLYRQSVLFF